MSNDAVEEQDISKEEQVFDIFELLPGKMLDIQINHPVQVRLKVPLIGYQNNGFNRLNVAAIVALAYLLGFICYKSLINIDK